MNDKAWQSTYRKDEFDENLRYIIIIVSEVRLKASRTTIAKESILKIQGFKYFDFINKQYSFYFLEYIRKVAQKFPTFTTALFMINQAIYERLTAFRGRNQSGSIEIQPIDLNKVVSKDYPTTALTIDQKYRLKAQINLSDFLFRDLTLIFLPFSGSTPRALTAGGGDMTDFSYRQSLALISATSQQPIPTIEVPEDIKIITKGSTPTGPGYKESTPFSDVDETIIREAELDVLTLGDDPSRTYNESGLSSKKRKRDINIYGYNPSVSAAWKKNIANFSSRAATTANKNFLSKPIQFLIKYKKYRYIYYIYTKYLTSYFGLRTRELKERKIKKILKTIYQYRDNIGYLKIYHDYYKI